MIETSTKSNASSVYARSSAPPHQHQAHCCCPACVSLECQERPRFFAGQLLTDADLTSEQSYVLAKNRLHNRYLHGVGVVCGLEVTCGDCAGIVNISPGYAIDPCGNDIIVCSSQEFNLMQAIQDCCAAQKKKQPDCRPYDPVPARGCTGLEEEWCITLRYQEKEARAVATLPKSQPSSCKCGCGGKKKSCGCGCHSAGNGNGSSSASSTATQDCHNPPLSVCEPTRIVETFQLGVCQHQEKSASLRSVLLHDTLLGRIAECLKSLWEYLRYRVPPRHYQVLYEAVLLKQAKAPPAAIYYEAHSRFYRTVIDLYTQNPFRVRCSGLKTLDYIQTPVPGENEEDGAYYEKTAPWTRALFGLVVQYAIDCVCHALLPPCPPDPCDDRLVLACVTIKDGRILRICNFSCRQFAGAFPSFFYWLSAVPIVPLLKWLIEKLCCRPDLVRAYSPLVDDFSALMDKLDPTGKLRAAVVEDNFALIKRYTSGATDIGKHLGDRLVSFIFNPGDVNLAVFRGKSLKETGASLEQAKINARFVTVKSESEIPVLSSLINSPFASAGHDVVVYHNTDGQVLAVHRSTASGEGSAQSVGVKTQAASPDALESLRQEVAGLRSEVDKLRKSS